MVKYSKSIFLTLILLTGLALRTFSQEPIIFPKDSVSISYFKGPSRIPLSLDYKIKDTIIYHNHQYVPGRRANEYYAGLGNLGLAQKNLIPEFRANEGMTYGRNRLDVYGTEPDEVIYYQSKRPYSNIFFVMGPSRENLLQVTHSQNFYKGLTIGVKYRLISSIGPYTQQRTDNTNIVVNARYFSPSRNYGIMAGYLVNNYKSKDNGGIQSDSIFENNIETNRAVLGVNLQNALSHTIKNRFYITQFLEPSLNSSVNEEEPDSLIADTTLKSAFLKKFSLGRLEHRMVFSRDQYLYTDAYPKAGFYPAPLLDTVATNDSTMYLQLENELSWATSGFLHKSNFPLKFRLALKHQYTRVANDSTSSTWHQFIPNASIALVIKDKIELNGHAFVVSGGYNDGDYGISGKLSLTPFQKFNSTLVVDGGFFSEMPGYFYKSYLSNHFIWNNTLTKQNILYISPRLKINQITLGADYYLLSNLAYFSYDGNAKQNSKEISLIRGSAAIDYSWRRIHLQANAWYQYLNDTSALRLPTWIIKATLSYSGKIFKSALWIEPGIDFTWNSAYYADNYMPALQSFYLSNLKEIGGFPWIDLFVNFKVKRAQIFLRLRHLNSGWSGYNYYDTPHYPLYDGGINFGVSWNFYD